MGVVFRFLHSNILHHLKNKHVLHSNTRQYIMSLEIIIITSILGSNFILPWGTWRPWDLLSFHLLTKPFYQVIYTSLTANFTTNNYLLVLFIHNSFSVHITAMFCNIYIIGSFSCSSHKNARMLKCFLATYHPSGLI